MLQPVIAVLWPATAVPRPALAILRRRFHCPSLCPWRARGPWVAEVGCGGPGGRQGAGYRRPGILRAGRLWHRVETYAGATAVPFAGGTDFRPTGIDIELLFPEGYDATRAGVTVAATHWQFAANSGAYKSPTHYLFALQPKSPAGDSGAAGPTAPPDTAAVAVERIRTASGADAVLRFTLQAGEQGVTITDCR